MKDDEFIGLHLDNSDPSKTRIRASERVTTSFVSNEILYRCVVCWICTENLEISRSMFYFDIFFSFLFPANMSKRTMCTQLVGSASKLATDAWAWMP